MSGEFLNKDLKKAHQLSMEVMYRQPNEKNTGVIKGVGFTAEYQFKYYVNVFTLKNL